MHPQITAPAIPVACVFSRQDEQRERRGEGTCEMSRGGHEVERGSQAVLAEAHARHNGEQRAAKHAHRQLQACIGRGEPKMVSLPGQAEAWLYILHTGMT